jgi:hypothetical protein
VTKLLFNLRFDPLAIDAVEENISVTVRLFHDAVMVKMPVVPVTLI